MDFFDNGIIKKISLKNKITGSSQIIWFDKSGNVTLFEKKRENIRDGQCIWFYPNGIIQNTSIFKNGNRDGAAFMFYEDGSIKNHRFWKGDKRVGYATDFIQDSIGTLNNIYFYESDTIKWWQPTSAKGITVNPSKDSSH